MKSSTIPDVRAEPELRAQVEALLGECETVSEFVEAAGRASVQRRLHQAEFVARGLHSLADAQRSGDCVDADKVPNDVQRRLDAAKARTGARRC